MATRPHLVLAEAADSEPSFQIYDARDRALRGPPRPRAASVAPRLLPRPRTRPAPRVEPLPLVVAPRTSSSSSAIFDPALVEPSPLQRVGTRAVAVTIPAPIESEALAVLEAPPRGGETIEVAYTRKERELGAVLARLSVLECRALLERLRARRADDALAQQFARLAEPRRARLLAFLHDARRRAALAAARR